MTCLYAFITAKYLWYTVQFLYHEAFAPFFFKLLYMSMHADQTKPNALLIRLAKILIIFLVYMVDTS